jgi:hypothetical protein
LAAQRTDFGDLAPRSEESCLTQPLRRVSTLEGTIHARVTRHQRALNETFFADGRWRANFLVNLGYGDPSGNHPRGPRLAFDDVARIE